MKKILYLLSFLCLFTFNSYSQEEGRLREKLTEYIEQKLGLTKAESEKFEPVFIEYFKELRRTNQQYRGDKLVLQQKIVELRLKYRDQFKPIIGEKRSNEVFHYEREFVKEVKELREDRQQGRGNKRL